MDKTRKLTVSACLAAASVIVFVIEAQLPSLTPVSGIKLGLANIFTLCAVYTVGPLCGFGVFLVRVVIGGFSSGQPSAIIYSLAGGIPALLLTVLLYRRFPLPRIWVLSAFSAIVHNSGQLTAAILLLGTKELLYYYPILVAAGIITGSFTGLCAYFVLNRLPVFRRMYKAKSDIPKRANTLRGDEHHE